MRRIIGFLLASVFLFSTASCNSGKSRGSLSIYLNTANGYLFGGAVNKYKSTYGGAEVQVESLGDNEEYGKKLAEDLAAGKGPDIIIADPNTFTYIREAICQGCLCDINELIKADRSFKLSDCNEKVMESGIFGGKRLLIPINYSINMFFTTKDLLDSGNMEPGEGGLSWEKLAVAAGAYMDGITGQDKYFFDGGMSFSRMLQSSGLSPADYISRESLLNNSRVTDMAAVYKEMAGCIYPKGQDDKSGTGADMLGKGTAVMYSEGPAGDPRDLWYPYLSFDKEANPAAYPYPSYGDGSKVYAQTYYLVGINAKCKDKGAATDFIKTLLSEDFQESEQFFYCPVNRKALEGLSDEFIAGKSNKSYEFRELRGGGIQTGEAAKYLADKLNDAVDDIDGCGITDNMACKIIDDEIEPYVQGDITADNLAVELTQKLNDYLNNRGEYAAEAASGRDKPSIKAAVGYGIKIVKDAAGLYNQKYSDIPIECETVSEEAMDKLTVSVMAGDGPDVFAGIDFNSPYKLMENGVFCDLDQIIAGDKTFNLGDYDERALQCGMYKGKRYMIPINYTYTVFVTTQEILDKNNIKIDKDAWTLDALRKLAKNYAAENPGQSNKFLSGIVFSFVEVLLSSGIEFVDYESRTASFKTSEFLELLDCYKDLRPFFSQDGDVNGSLENGNSVFVLDLLLTDPFAIGARYEDNSEMLVYPFPVYKEDYTPVARPMYTIAVSAACKYKQAALDYIKIVLSKEVLDLNHGFHFFHTVNKKANEERVKYYTSEEYAKRNSGPYSEAVAEQMSRIDSMYGEIRMLDRNVNGIISGALTDFLDGKKTPEQTAEEIQRKVQLYLNE